LTLGACAVCQAQAAPVVIVADNLHTQGAAAATHAQCAGFRDGACGSNNSTNTCDLVISACEYKQPRGRKYASQVQLRVITASIPGSPGVVEAY
jgi:hypothetical protein